MTVTISPAFLFDVQRGEAADAELWDSITERQMEDWERQWAPALIDGLQRLQLAGVPFKNWPQSWHWNWRKKTQAMQGLLATPGFSVMCCGITQGLMLVERVAHRCQIPEQAGKHLIYVDFLETAPWNRKDLFNPPRYKGIGSLLIRAAIELSREEGFKGRIGLHSLPQANNWYANMCGMADLGADAHKQNLHYFEMTPGQAGAFIAKGNHP